MEKVYLSQLLKDVAIPMEDVVVSSVVVDSRQVQENSVFLAIRGERVNGEDYAAKARLLRSHGMTTMSYQRAKGHATSYDINELGYNFRMDDIRASIGCVQMRKSCMSLHHRLYRVSCPCILTTDHGMHLRLLSGHAFLR